MLIKSKDMQKVVQQSNRQIGYYNCNYNINGLLLVYLQENHIKTF